MPRRTSRYAAAADCLRSGSKRPRPWQSTSDALAREIATPECAIARSHWRHRLVQPARPVSDCSTVQSLLQIAESFEHAIERCTRTVTDKFN